MKRIDWLEKYSLNIPEIDEQHKKLFDILNKLIEHKDINVNSRVVVDTLTEMTNYTEYHFKEEESYMEKCGFPDLENHKKEHRNFIMTTGRLNAKTMERHTKVPDELLDFLISWLIKHIIESDFKLKEYYHSTVSR